MLFYVARRLIISIPVLVLVSLIVFSLPRVLPGDAVMLLLSDVGTLGKADLEKMRHLVGLDRPYFVQYFTWLGGMLHGYLGQSLWSNMSVGERILASLPTTVELVFLSMLLSFVAGILVGLLAAVRQNTWGDYSARFFVLLGLSVPNYWIGTLVLFILSTKFGWIPPLQYVNPFKDPIGNATAFFWPALIMGYVLTAQVARMTRSSLLEVIREDYIRTARSKGLRERVVLFRHAVRNALIPVITIGGVTMGRLLGTTVVVEQIFALPGLGRLTVDAVFLRDYPQIQGNLMFIAVVVMAINLLTDLSYGWLDPRIRYT